MGQNFLKHMIILAGSAMLTMACQRHEVTAPLPAPEGAGQPSPSSVISPKETPSAQPVRESAVPAPEAAPEVQTTTSTEEKSAE